MKAFYSTLLLLLLFPLFGQAQGWERVYPKAGNQFITHMDYTSTGNIRFAGYGNSFSGSFHYLEVDLNGDTLWSRTDDAMEYSMYDIIYDTEGRMLMTGASPNMPNGHSYLKMIDSIGNTLWQINTPPREYASGKLAKASDGNYYLAQSESIFSADTIRSNMRLYKVDEDGNELFVYSYFGVDVTVQGGINPTAIIGASDGGALMAYSKLDSLTSTMVYLKVDDQGNEMWRTEMDDPWFINDIIELSDGSFIAVGESWRASTGADTYMIRLDAQGGVVWTKRIPQAGDNRAHSISATLDGNFFVSGTTEGTPFHATLSKISPAGDIIWINDYPNRGSGTSGFRVLTASDGGAYIGCGYNSLSNDRDYFLIKTDSNGVSLTNEVFGTIFRDSVENCAPDLGESGLPNWIITLDGAAAQEFAALSTAPDGLYSLPAGEGDYVLRPIPPSPYWDPCQESYNISFTANDSQAINLDLPIQIEVECPYLEVSIGTWALRPCFLSTYTVRYCNLGTAVAEDAYVEVSLDSLIVVDTASIDYTYDNGTYTFPLGDIAIGDCGAFQIGVILDCNAPVGLTHCVEAHIFPDSLCIPNGNWSGASVEVGADCVDGEIAFNIQNVGTAAITSPVSYLVVEDDVILMQGEVEQLSVGEIFPLPLIPGQGGTFRLEAEQEPFHPGFDAPSVAIEACGNGPFNLGFVNLFPQNDANPFVDIDCRVSTAAYDPNDKQGFPVGVTDDHLIKANQDIEYLIRFQNVGTDTAFNVVILDTLSTLLDLSSIRTGASSHPYEFKMSGRGILEFKFNNILLPDSTTNEVGSNGFVKFRIKQKVDLDLGQRIVNRAAIYFDFNDPVITNTTWHTIGEFPLINTSVNPLALDEPRLNIQPNPMGEEALIELEGYEGNDDLELRIYDALGRLQRVEIMRDNILLIERENMRMGIYFIQVLDGKLQTLAQERLIIP